MKKKLVPFGVSPGLAALALAALGLAACEKPAPPAPVVPTPPKPTVTVDATVVAAPTPPRPGVTDAGALPAVAVGLRVVKLAVGHAACAVMSNGTVRCWGPNNYGETGVGRVLTDSASPVQIPGITDAVDVVMGGDPGDQGDLVCARRRAGKVSCWGYKRLSPEPDGDDTSAGPVEIATLANVSVLALSGGRGAIVTPEGKVKAWGVSAFNALTTGEGDYTDKTLMEIPGVADVAQVVSGQNHMCALKKDGTVMCWGYSGKKQMPTVVPGIDDATSIVSGNFTGMTCVITQDHKVMCWDESQQPAEVPEVAGAIALAGHSQMCALLPDKSVKCWLSNYYGQLGDPATLHSNPTRPVRMKLPGPAVAVAAGANMTCALLESGTVACVGRNDHGQLGDGTLMDRREAVEVAGLTGPTLAPVRDGTAQTQEARAVMDWTGLPAGCSRGPLAVSYAKLVGDTFDPVSAYATSEFGGKTVWIYLTNYKVDPGRMNELPRGNQFRLSLHLVHVNLQKANEAMAIDNGVYEMDSAKDRYVMTQAATRYTNETIALVSLEGIRGGGVTVSHLDADWICGTMEVTGENHTRFSGPFAARIHR